MRLFEFTTNLASWKPDPIVPPSVVKFTDADIFGKKREYYGKMYFDVISKNRKDAPKKQMPAWDIVPGSLRWTVVDAGSIK
jgi:hypothetical protein